MEDDPQVRFAVAALLHRHGFEVAVCPGPMARAVVAVERRRPHVVVIEIALTGIAGLAALSSIRTAAPGCAIIVLSQLEGLRQAALEAGASDVVGTTDLRRLAACVRHLESTAAAACDCCRRPVADCRSAPALGEGSLRVEGTAAVGLRIDRPGALSSGAQSDGEQSSASTTGLNRRGE